MDPVIAGTLIGGGFATLGTAASIWATSRTLRANRQMAANDRLWEKRSALSEQMLEPLIIVDTDHFDVIRESLEPLRSQVFAYASDNVELYYRMALDALKQTAEAQQRSGDIDVFWTLERVTWQPVRRPAHRPGRSVPHCWPEGRWARQAPRAGSRRRCSWPRRP